MAAPASSNDPSLEDPLAPSLSPSLSPLLVPAPPPPPASPEATVTLPRAGSIRFPLAWMGSLVVVDGSFLLAAAAIHQPGWASAVLVIAAVINVPLFLGALLLLRGKF